MNTKEEAAKVAKALSRYAITHDYSVFQAAEDGFVAGAKWALENQWIVVKGKLHQYVTSNSVHHKEGFGIEPPICKKCSLYSECNRQVSVLHFCRDYEFGKGYFVNKGEIEIK